VIETANRIFGFAHWSRETVATECLHEPRLITDPSSPEANKVVAAYSARGRITVFAGDRIIVREGSGAARDFAKTVGEALELALKSAETDGMKQALVTVRALPLRQGAEGRCPTWQRPGAVARSW